MTNWRITFIQMAISFLGIIQQFIGIFSDRCTSRLGRMSSFLLFGGFLTLACFTLFALVEESS